jgi:hypothetical protein
VSTAFGRGFAFGMEPDSSAPSQWPTEPAAVFSFFHLHHQSPDRTKKHIRSHFESNPHDFSKISQNKQMPGQRGDTF